jgi:Leucine-rich repeat (LRR) protein
VRKLNLESNRLGYIDPNAFIELINYLEELYIDAENIDQIPQSVFNLANLKILKLNGFNLKEFSLQNLQKLKKLDKFYLINSKVVNIYGFQTQADAIQQLKLLSLQSNKIETIDESLFNYLYNLETLNLNDNDLTNLDFNLKNLTRLHTLDLSYNGIAKLNSNLFDPKKNVQLQRLLLNNNELTNVKQKFFKNLVGLKEVNMDFNKLVTLESNVFLNNNNLEILSINNNFLTDINEQAFNGLKTSLQRLHLSRNKLKHLNDDLFIYTTSLQQLFLDRNLLTTLNRNTFFGLETSLVELNMQFNRIRTLNGSVKYLKSLQKLKLSNNQLESFSFSGEFENCLNLTMLNMESNAIDRMPDLSHVQTRFVALHEIDVTSNSICTLGPSPLNKFKDLFPNLRYLKLNNNRLRCDCDLIELKIYFGFLNEQLTSSSSATATTTHNDMNNYQCQLPSVLMGTSLNKLSEMQLVCDDTTKAQQFPNCTATDKASSQQQQQQQLTTNSEFEMSPIMPNRTTEIISDILIDLSLATNTVNVTWLLNDNRQLADDNDDEHAVKYFLLNSRIFNKHSNELVFHANKYILPTSNFFEIKNVHLNSTDLLACKISVCVSVIRKSSQEKYCKNFFQNESQQQAINAHETKAQKTTAIEFPNNSQQPKAWYNLFDSNQVYGIIGALLGILLAFFLAFAVYYLKIRRLNGNNSNLTDKQRNFYESAILNDQLLGSGDSATTTTSTTTNNNSNKQKSLKVDFLTGQQQQQQHMQPQHLILSSHLINPNLTLNSSTYSSNSNQHTLSSIQQQQRKFFLQQLNNPANPALTYHVYHEIPDNMFTQPPSYSTYNECNGTVAHNYFPNRTSSFNTNSLSSYKPVQFPSNNSNS